MSVQFPVNVAMITCAFGAGLAYPFWPSVVLAVVALLLAITFCDDRDDDEGI